MKKHQSAPREASDMVRIIVTLSGRVQGVGFRAAVLDAAARHHVAGSVRNRRDGARLEIDVEGDPPTVERFIDDVLARPPRFARIDRVERRDAPPRNVHAFSYEPTA